MYLIAICAECVSGTEAGESKAHDCNEIQKYSLAKPFPVNTHSIWKYQWPHRKGAGRFLSGF